MTYPPNPDHEIQASQTLWLKRLESVSRAQARYLLLIAIAGVFFFALDQAITSSSTISQTTTVPGVRVEISSAILWAIGPTALMFFVLAVNGTVWALNKASRHVGAVSDLSFEATDAYPNALDLAFYTVERSPKLGRALGEFVYPGYLWLFVVEAVWLWIRIFQRRAEVPSHELFLLIAFVPTLPAVSRLIQFSWGRLKKAIAIFQPNRDKETMVWPEF